MIKINILKLIDLLDLIPDKIIKLLRYNKLITQLSK